MCLRRMYNPYVKFVAYLYFTPEAGVFKHRLLCFCTKLRLLHGCFVQQPLFADGEQKKELFFLGGKCGICPSLQVILQCGFMWCGGHDI